MTGRYPTWCPTCRDRHPAGAEIAREPGGQWRVVRCDRAARTAAVAAAPTAAPTPTPAAAPPRPPRAVRRNARPGRCYECAVSIDAGAGRLWRCLGSSSNHFECEDRSDDGGAWHVSCLDSDACEARYATARMERLAREEAARVRHTARRALCERAYAEGTSPRAPDGGQVDLVGETVALDDGRTRAYGGGHWAVIEPADAADRAIWIVRNNGADGDDWGHNNVRTGGAGAIGWRLPWSTELDRDVRALAWRAPS